MKLFVVRPDKYLHWPPEIDKLDKLWLGPGGVIDMDDEFVRKCAEGQEYKLEPATTATAPTPVTHKAFNALRDAFNKAGAPPESKVQPTPPEAAKDIPRPDSRPKKGEEKKHGPVQGSVSPGHP